MSNQSRVVLIGNGFDLHHGLESSYWHYKEWLKGTHPDLLRKLECYIDVSGEWWNDFERNLAEFDIMKIIKECPHVYPTHDFRFPPALAYSSNWFFDALRKDLTDSFVEWVKTITRKEPFGRIDLPEAKLYLSFNYTDTLERTYGIYEERILYLHGKALRGDKLIFGHNKSHFEIERDYMRKHGLREIESFNDTGPVISDEEYELSQKVSFLDKFPYAQIVKYSDILQPAIKSSCEIVSFGLSFSAADSQYLEWIVDQNSNLRWNVSWHSSEDKEKQEAFFHQMGITDYSFFEL